MPVLDVAQQNVFGTIFKLSFQGIKVVLTGIVTILLFPYYVLKFVFSSILRPLFYLLPEFKFYKENLAFTFRPLFYFFKFLFGIATFLLLFVLLPLHLLPLFGVRPLLNSTFGYEFHLGQALITFGKTFFTAEIVLLVGSFLGFLLLLLGFSTAITVYSPIKFLAEVGDGLTNAKALFYLTLLIALIVLGIVFLIVTGRLPI